MTQDPSLWNNPEKAQKLISERTRLIDKIEKIQSIESEVHSSYEMIELSELENELEILAEAENSFVALDKTIDELLLTSLLCQEGDGNDTFLEIHSGAGGTESQDWASMLQRMYTRWAEKNGYRVTLLEESPGDEAGIKSATLKVEGIILRVYKALCVQHCVQA